LKIAIVFDNQNRLDTTGVYCRRALQGKHEVDHFLPDQMDQIRPDQYDLFINIDDGRSYRFRPDLHPSLFWAIDTHVKPERCLEKARDFDLVFCAQRPGAKAMRKAGVAARWCPLAFDPEIHRKHPLAKILDISFVGNSGRFRWRNFFYDGKEVFRERTKLLSLLKKRFDLFMGKFFFEDMAVVFSLSKIVFNKSVKDDVNMRVFEALGCGSLLLTNQIGPGQDLLFKNGEHIVEYRSRKELIEKAEYYLKHEEEREKIAAQGREEVLRKHTYAHRMDYMLSFLTPSTPKRFDFSRVPPAQDEWVFEQAALAQFIPEGKKGIDVGCGPRKIAKGAVGIDILRNGSEADILASGDQLPFGKEALDFVVASHNLEHYDDIQKTLGEWKRVLKKGGIIGMVVPDDRIIDTLALNPQHKHALTPELLKDHIQRSGGLEIEVLQEIIDAWSFGCICRKVSGEGVFAESAV
jgi:predicted SAM-dependent methyltransferase